MEHWETVQSRDDYHYLVLFLFSVVITGCDFENLGVQIQSEVLGHWIFQTENDMALKLTKDEDLDYEYDDFVLEAAPPDTPSPTITATKSPSNSKKKSSFLSRLQLILKWRGLHLRHFRL